MSRTGRLEAPRPLVGSGQRAVVEAGRSWASESGWRVGWLSLWVAPAGNAGPRPRAQGCRKRHTPECKGHPAKRGVTQEARKARTTAELGHGGASRSLDLTCHSVEPPHWEAAGGKGPAQQGAGAPQLLPHVALTEAGRRAPLPGGHPAVCVSSDRSPQTRCLGFSGSPLPQRAGPDPCGWA